MSSRIVVEGLQKVFRVPVRDPGLIPAVKSILHPRFNEVKAVDNISFHIEEGEIVGFIGPNGAGKTTTLKVLSGLLHPTAGNVSVAGFSPWERKPQYLKRISMLMGNKSQMQWNNTVYDSYYIFKEIYHIPTREFKSRMEELFSLFTIEGLLHKQCRNLSLGERAKCEFIAALIHNPQILYLDEPTLGMDVTIQLRLRSYIRDYNKKYGTTILLTSHYMSDIVSLCPRVMLIHKGELMFDGELAQLSGIIAPFKLIKLSFGEGESISVNGLVTAAGVHFDVMEQEGQSMTLRVRKEDALSVAAFFMNRYSLADLSIQDPSMEAVIDQVYREGVRV